MLDDVRPYPQDDSDFSFRDENEERDGEEEEQEEEEGLVNDNGERDNMNDYQGYSEVGQDADGKTIKYENKVLDDPTLFAYPPTDPRFYEESLQPGKYKM